MYLYSLHGFEHNRVLTHEKQFTEEEFASMCDEAPKYSLEHSRGTEYYYDDYEIEHHLINKYGFKQAEYQVALFVD